MKSQRVPLDPAELASRRGPELENLRHYFETVHPRLELIHFILGIFVMINSIGSHVYKNAHSLIHFSDASTRESFEIFFEMFFIMPKAPTAPSVMYLYHHDPTQQKWYQPHDICQVPCCLQGFCFHLLLLS